VLGCREELVDLCTRLVAAPSQNPPGDTRAVAGVVAGYLWGRGLDPELVAAVPTMPSVVATVEGARPGPHLVLNVHLDTMEPGDESLWSVPLHEVTRRDGRLYGLGMGNMKGAVAGMTLAFALLAERRAEWAGRLTLTAVSDECVFGDHGAAHLLATRRDEVLGDAVVNGEGPGFGRLALAEKGVAWYELSASAEGGHSSRARPGATATARLAAALLALDELGGRRGSPPPELAAAEPAEALELTVNAGTVAGGTFVSQIATRATAMVDVRVPPGISLAELEAEIDARVTAVPGTTWRRVKAWEANWSGLDVPFVQAFADVVGEVRGRPAEPTVRLPASDASRWRALGVPAVCYGPQPTLSAGLDDYAEEQDVVDCAAIYALAVWDYLSGRGS
jgi:succinyl-diaminopimelate desuccinylase